MRAHVTPRRARWRPGALAALALLGLPAAQALEIDTGRPDWSLRFDNTVKAGLIYRLNNANPALADTFRQVPTGAPPPAPATFSFPQAENFNAGDDNFRNKGLVSERLDLQSEFDAVYQKNFGLRASAAAWYDNAYRGKTDATDPVNGQTPNNEFPAHTKALAGREVELLVMRAFGFNDLLPSTAYVSGLYNSKPAQYVLKPRYSDALFTPKALAGESVR